jgi:hypothetical protein
VSEESLDIREESIYGLLAPLPLLHGRPRALVPSRWRGAPQQGRYQRRQSNSRKRRALTFAIRCPQCVESKHGLAALVDTPTENGAGLPAATGLLHYLRIVNKPKGPKSPVVSVCPSCGLATVDSPHGNSDLCIRALEAEVARLSELVKKFRQEHAQTSPDSKRR